MSIELLTFQMTGDNNTGSARGNDATTLALTNGATAPVRAFDATPAKRAHLERRGSPWHSRPLASPSDGDSPLGELRGVSEREN
jgi:hypothetical protein